MFVSIYSDKIFVIPRSSVADPHHVDADPDPAFHFDADADPDLTFLSFADPDPTFKFDPDPTTHFSQDLDRLVRSLSVSFFIEKELCKQLRM